MHSAMDDHKWPGFPIQKSTDQSLFASSLWLIAGYNVFHRLSMPRHPPYALSSFVTPTSNRRTLHRRPSAEITHRGRLTPVTRRGTSRHTPGGMCFGLMRHGQAPQNACTRCCYTNQFSNTQDIYPLVKEHELALAVARRGG